MVAQIMTFHGVLSSSWKARLGVTGAARMLVGAAMRFLRLGLPVLFASCVSGWLLGCGAARVPAVEWAQELHGKSVFRVCRRQPRVGPNARDWFVAYASLAIRNAVLRAIFSIVDPV